MVGVGLQEMLCVLGEGGVNLILKEEAAHFLAYNVLLVVRLR